MSALVTAACAYLGVKFQHQGRSKNGVDCLGLVAMAAKDAGIVINDRADYSHSLTHDELKNGVLSHCQQIDKPVVGCLALFEMTTRQQHVAIVTAIDPVYIIHAYAPARKVCEHRLPTEHEHGIYVNQQNLIGFYLWLS